MKDLTFNNLHICKEGLYSKFGTRLSKEKIKYIYAWKIHEDVDYDWKADRESHLMEAKKFNDN